MAIEWLAGNRLRGTTAERPNLGLPSGSVGGWVELGRTTLGSNNANINVSSIPDKRYYMILSGLDLTGVSTGGGARLGNNTVDTGSNYAMRYSVFGGADTTLTSTNKFLITGGSSADPELNVTYIANKSDKEKLIISHRSYGIPGASNPPKRFEFVSKWSNTSNPLDVVNFYQGGSDQYASGSEVVVLGWDPADTHTTNFWEELASVELTSTNTVLDSGIFTAKRYLWIQLFAKANTSLTSIGGRYNGDTGNNYANRYSDNGGTDGTNTSQPIHTWTVGGDLASGETQFTNVFVINNASNEKLSICHTVEKGTSGASTAPTRRETVGKWANTTDQITQVQLVRTNTTGDFASGSFIKVWGAD